MGDDPIARMRAEMDQSREGVKEYASMLWAFHSELVKQGFDQQQALGLTMAFLTEGIRGGVASTEGDE